MSYFLNKKNLLALLFIGLGLFLFLNSKGDQGILYKAVTDEIDPMDFPRLLLKFWIGLSVLYFFFPAKPFDASGLKENAKPIILSVSCLMFYVFIFPYLGIFTSSFLFLVSFYYIHKYNKAKKTFPIAFATAFIIWVAFVKILAIPLPVDLILGG